MRPYRKFRFGKLGLNLLNRYWPLRHRVCSPLPVLTVLALTFVLGMPVPPQASATILTVTDCGDNGGANQVRAQLAVAMPGDVIHIIACTVLLSAGQLTVNTNLTIEGAGATQTIIDGRGIDRVFFVSASATATIAGLTIRNGRTDTTGGGIHNEGTLTVANSTLSGNTIRNNGSGGGGIYNIGTLTIIGSTISGNAAAVSGPNAGGGLFNGGMMTIMTSRITGNSAGIPNTAFGFGGGVMNSADGGTLIMTDTTVDGNTASDGGGLMNHGVATLARTTISGNTGCSGGGISNDATLSATNVTISGNTGCDGGGIRNNGSLMLTNVTITNNIGTDGGGLRHYFYGPAQLKNTIVANSPSGGNCSTSSALLSLGHNLDSGTTCGFTAVGDLSSTDPQLGPLVDNGGFTQTHALLGEAAIDKGDNAGCPATDQRGVARPQGAACDIGAYENALPLATLLVVKAGVGSGTVTSSPTGISCGEDCSEQFVTGMPVILTAASQTSAVDWSGGGCSGTGRCTVVLSGDTTVTATFTPGFPLTVTKQGSGSGVVTSSPPGIDCGTDCSEFYVPGTSVTLTATAAADSVFGGWTGSGCGGSDPCVVVVNGVMSVAATFFNRASPFVLHDHGPLVNGTFQVSGTGPAGPVFSLVQDVSLGMDIAGFGDQLPFGIAVADDFTVPEPGWTVTQITLFAFQIGSSSLSSTMNDVRLLIFDGPPNTPGSTVVWGDVTKNVLSQSTFSGIYRAAESSPIDTELPIMANTVSVNAFLPPGHYWLAWASGGVLPSGPWAPPITLAGLATTGHGLQLFNGEWAPAVDDGTGTPQGFPFIITGVGPPTSALPTLTLQLNQTAVQPGQTMVVRGTLDAGSLPVPVDVYAVLKVPDGQLFSLQQNGSLVPGLRPAATGLMNPAFNGEIWRRTFTAADPAGVYTWFAAVTQRGTLNVLGAIDQHAFTVGP